MGAGEENNANAQNGDNAAGMRYRSFSCSARGASHIKYGLPCQDSSLDEYSCGPGSSGTPPQSHADRVAEPADGTGTAPPLDIDTVAAPANNTGTPPPRAIADSASRDEIQIPYAIAVVADGHGNPLYFRSDIGSRIAADAAVSAIREFIRQNPCAPESFLCEPACPGAPHSPGATPSPGAPHSTSAPHSPGAPHSPEELERLAARIVSEWRARVLEDAAASPLSGDPRIGKLDARHRGVYAGGADPQGICRAYGTTLIAAAATDSYWFGLQVGDGKCVALFEGGEWAQPIPWDDNCFLNVTTSICDSDCLNEFRYWRGCPRSSPRPVAVFLGTDGVDDTYPVYENERHLENLYGHIVQSFAVNGFDETNAQVALLAKKFAEQGSQDDVSIAGIVMC